VETGSKDLKPGTEGDVFERYIQELKDDDKLSYSAVSGNAFFCPYRRKRKKATPVFHESRLSLCTQ
jgi:hypothetical protein